MKTAKKRCGKKGCRNEATTERFCRLHYISHWQPPASRTEEPSREDKLNYYIREITRRHPHEYLEIIKRDLSDGASFKKSLKELNIDLGKDEATTELERHELLKKIKHH